MNHPNTVSLVSPMTITTTLRWLQPETMQECRAAQARLREEEVLAQEAEENENLSRFRHGMPHEI